MRKKQKLGYKLSSDEQHKLAVLEDNEYALKAIASSCKCLDDNGRVDRSRMSSADRKEYDSRMRETLALELAHSKEMVKRWEKEGRTEVSLTPFARKVIQDQFPDSLDLRDIRLQNGGFFLAVLNFLDDLFNNGSTGAMTIGNTVYNMRPKKDFDGQPINSGPGGFDQFSQDDLGLLTHEITHTVQQREDGLLKFGWNYLFEYGRPGNYGIAPFKGAEPRSVIGMETIKTYKENSVTYDNIADMNAEIFNRRYERWKNEGGYPLP